MKIRQTHCKRGHPLSGDNLIMVAKSWDREATTRACRECRRIHRELSRRRDNPKGAKPMRDVRDAAVLKQRVEALADQLMRLIDLEVCRGEAGQHVAEQALLQLQEEGYLDLPEKRGPRGPRANGTHVSHLKPGKRGRGRPRVANARKSTGDLLPSAEIGA